MQDSKEPQPVGDWRQAALTELGMLLKTIARAQADVAAAEKLHAGLALLGLPVPDLPWKTGGMTHGGHRQPSAPNCARCGRAFNAATETKRDEQGRIVCRSKARCAPADVAESAT